MCIRCTDRPKCKKCNRNIANKKEATREVSFNKEISDIFNDTLKNIVKMQSILRKQEDSEKKDLHYNGRFFSEQKNLDNLRLAHSTIRQMSVGLNQARLDWNKVEKK